MKCKSKRKWTRSLFIRLFSSTAAILCLGFTIIVIVTTVISTSMWRAEHINNLKQNTLAVAESFKEIDSVGYTAELRRTATAVANSYNSTVFFVTLDGNTYIYLIDTENNIFKAKASEHENMLLLEAGDTVELSCSGSKILSCKQII